MKGNPGVSKIKNGYNPATWMLEVTSPSQETALGIDFADIYKSSELYRLVHDALLESKQQDGMSVFCFFSKLLLMYLLCFRRNKALIKDLSKPAPGSKDLHFDTQYAQSFFTQCMACLWKQRWSYWRNPPYTAVRFLSTTITSLTFGTMFWDMGTKM